MQALADAEHGVIAEAVRFLSSVCHERQIRKPSLLAAARKVSHWVCCCCFCGELQRKSVSVH